MAILTMSLLHLWALNESVALLPMPGQKAFRFHQKYLNLCCKMWIFGLLHTIAMSLCAMWLPTLTCW